MQILYLHGLAFTLIDAVLLIHLRNVFFNLKEKISQYKNYRKLLKDMRER